MTRYEKEYYEDVKDISKSLKSINKLLNKKGDEYKLDPIWNGPSEDLIKTKFDEVHIDIKEIEIINHTIKIIINNHNSYLKWENTEIDDTELVLQLLQDAIEHPAEFHPPHWCDYIRNNLNNEANSGVHLGKKSSGSFYTSLIEFDNHFFDELISEEGYDLAFKEYKKLTKLYTDKFISYTDK
jgi:hypothetical protein